MNELIEQPTKQTEEISIRIVMSAGEDFIQPLSIEDLEGAQNLMNWFRNPKQGPVWTWQVPSVRKAHMLHRIHIMGIDIDGYIEPDDNKVRWYHRMVDRFRVWLMSRKVYSQTVIPTRVGEPIETEEGQAYHTQSKHDVEGNSES